MGFDQQTVPRLANRFSNVEREKMKIEKGREGNFLSFFFLFFCFLFFLILLFEEKKKQQIFVVFFFLTSVLAEGAYFFKSTKRFRFVFFTGRFFD